MGEQCLYVQPPTPTPLLPEVCNPFALPDAQFLPCCLQFLLALGVFPSVQMKFMLNWINVW